MNPMHPPMPTEPQPIIDDDIGWMTIDFRIGGEIRSIRVDPLIENQEINDRWKRRDPGTSDTQYDVLVQNHLKEKHGIDVSTTGAIAFRSALLAGIERAKDFFDPWRTLHEPSASTPATSPQPNELGIYPSPKNSEPETPSASCETNGSN